MMIYVQQVKWNWCMMFKNLLVWTEHSIQTYTFYSYLSSAYIWGLSFVLCTRTWIFTLMITLNSDFWCFINPESNKLFVMMMSTVIVCWSIFIQDIICKQSNIYLHLQFSVTITAHRTSFQNWMNKGYCLLLGCCNLQY